MDFLIQMLKFYGWFLAGLLAFGLLGFLVFEIVPVTTRFLGYT